MKIRLKILMWFLGISLIPVFFVQIFIFLNIKDRLNQNLTDELFFSNQELASELSFFISKFKNESLALADLPPISGIPRASKTGTDPLDGSTLEQWNNRLKQIFVSFLSSDEELLNIVFLDTEGNELVKVERKDREITVIEESLLSNKGNEAYFKDGIKQKEEDFYISDIGLNLENGAIEVPFKPIIRYVAPTFLEGDITGVVIININPTRIFNKIVSLERAFILDQDGNYIFHKDEDKRFTNVLGGGNYFEESGGLLNNDIRKNLEAGHFFNEAFGTHVFWEKIPLDDEEKRYLIVVSSATEEQVNSIAKSFNYTLLILAVIIVLIIVPLSYVVSNSIFRPIEKIRDQAVRAANGDLDVRSTISSKDELGDLSKAFNFMIEKINESRKNIQKKVQEKTESLNDVLLRLEEKNKLQENTKKAVLNILSDLESEKGKMDAILSSMNEGLLAFNERMEIALVNQAASTLIRKAYADVVGKDVHDVLDMYKGDKKVDSKNSPITKALNQGVYTAKLVDDYYIKDKDGRKFPVVVSTAILPGKDYLEGLKGVVMFKDMTADKEIDQAKTEFVSLASHQLRTPLSTINWYAEMLLSGDAGELDENQKDYLKEIYVGNQRMVELVNALLNVSRIELGTFMVAPEEVRLSEISDAVISELEPIIKEKKIKITKNYSKEVDKYIGDVNLLTIIFQNLISNAVKYNKNEGELYIETKAGEKKMYLEIIIRDTGLGIPKNQQDKVFSKLFRADNVTESDTTGTGLGLYIVKAIAKSSKGAVEFKSTENQGTEFKVRLPLAGMEAKKGSKPLE